MENDLDPLLLKVESFLAKAEMTAAEFGIQALNDSSFVLRWRRGREPRKRTRDRVFQFMKEWRRTPTKGKQNGEACTQ